jgi:hypothetical protein
MAGLIPVNVSSVQKVLCALNPISNPYLAHLVSTQQQVPTDAQCVNLATNALLPTHLTESRVMMERAPELMTLLNQIQPVGTHTECKLSVTLLLQACRSLTSHQDPNGALVKTTLAWEFQIVPFAQQTMNAKNTT